MARYHFDLKQGDAIIPDTEGGEFRTLEQAYLEAFRGIREVWNVLLSERRDPRGYAYMITGANGELLMEVPFTEVLDACRGSETAPQLARPSSPVGAKAEATPELSATALEYRDQAKRNVMEGQERISRQQEIIARLTGEGQDVARAILQTFLQTQALHERCLAQGTR